MLQVYRANSQTILSSPVKFSTEILFFFSFFCFLWFFFVFVFALFFKLKYSILIHIWLCRQVNDTKIFTWSIFGNKTFFFLAWLCLRPATLLKKRLWDRHFFCKFSKISKNTCFYRTPPVVASERKSLLWNLLRTCILILALLQGHFFFYTQNFKQLFH